MEHIVTVKFESTAQEASFNKLSAVLAYLHEHSIILFEEQFDDIDVDLSADQKTFVKDFIQAHTDFYSSTEEFKISDDKFYALFVAGWDAKEAIAKLKKMFSLFSLKDYEISLKVY